MTTAAKKIKIPKMDAPTSSQTTKKRAQEKQEPESCPVCLDDYTAVIRKKVSCKYCKKSACAKCIERYLLERIEDAHCLHCRVNYDDTCLQEICTKTYLQDKYAKHRQEVLISRERANLPGLQDQAVSERRKRERHSRLQELWQTLEKLREGRDAILVEYNEAYANYHAMRRTSTPDIVDELFRTLREAERKSEVHRRMVNDKEVEYHQLAREQRYGVEEQKEGDGEDAGGSAAAGTQDKKKFIRRCTRDGCQGFLSTAWKCALCEYYSCNKCFTPRGQKPDDHHECRKEDVDTADLLRKDSKPCPNCGVFITKSEGCFSKNTPILCWNGHTKMSQDIALGDELVGDDGIKRTVISTVDGTGMMYKITQNSGMSYTVNSEHTLVLLYRGEYNSSMESFRMKDNVYEIPVKIYMVLPSSTQRQLFGYKESHNKRTLTSITVTNVGEGMYYGWAVDGNRRFVLSDTTCVRNCHQMFCVSCQTPFDWGTGKIITSGAIHNPHYFEWLQRNGHTNTRNPADVPCGGYPAGWEIRRIPRNFDTELQRLYLGRYPLHLDRKFFEFHRLCMEIQDVSTRNWQTHLTQDAGNRVNIQFLLGDYDETRWGRLLAQLERKRKRDREVQEVFAAFHMVAVELLNSYHNHHDPAYGAISNAPLTVVADLLLQIHTESIALFDMINDAFRQISIRHRYAAPFITLITTYGNHTRYNMIHRRYDEKEEMIPRPLTIGLTPLTSAAAAAAAATASSVMPAKDTPEESEELEESEEEEEEDDEDRVHAERYFHDLQQAIVASLTQ